MSGKTFTVRRGMTPVPNETIYGTFVALPDKDGDPGRLSIQALGVLLMALSRPSGKASMGYRAFLGRGMGRDALLKANRELSAAGLRFQFKRRGPGGSIITDTIISEVPMDPADAEEAWLEYIRQELKGHPEPVDNSAGDRAPETGATGPGGAGTVRRITGARSSGASTPRGVANSSSSTTYLEEEEETNAGAQEGHHEEPGDSADVAAPAQDPEDSPNRRAVREYLEAEKRAKLSALAGRGDKKDVAPLRPLTEAGPSLSGLAHQAGVLA